MSYQWLQMRISEENDRREREAHIQRQLPWALDELHDALLACLEAYKQAFGPEAADIRKNGSSLGIVIREEQEGRWEQRASVEITAVPSLPGFQVNCEGEPYLIEVGVLPNDKVSYRDREQDQYLTMDDLTRRILDRALFPKLGE